MLRTSTQCYYVDDKENNGNKGGCERRRKKTERKRARKTLVTPVCAVLRFPGFFTSIRRAARPRDYDRTKRIAILWKKKVCGAHCGEWLECVAGHCTLAMRQEPYGLFFMLTSTIDMAAVASRNAEWRKNKKSGEKLSTLRVSCDFCGKRSSSKQEKKDVMPTLPWFMLEWKRCCKRLQIWWVHSFKL